MAKTWSISDTANQMASNYYQDLPQNTKQTIFHSFALGFAVGVLFESPESGLVHGTLMAIATAIHALVTPLFKNMTGRTQLYWAEEVLRSGTGIGVAYSIAALAGKAHLANWQLGFTLVALAALFSEARGSTTMAQLVVV